MLPYLVICSCHLFASVLKKVYITSHEINTFPPHKKKPNTKGYKKYLHHTIVTSRKETYILWIWETSTPNPPCYETNSCLFTAPVCDVTAFWNIFPRPPSKETVSFFILAFDNPCFQQTWSNAHNTGKQTNEGRFVEGGVGKKERQILLCSTQLPLCLVIIAFFFIRQHCICVEIPQLSPNDQNPTLNMLYIALLPR